MTTTDIGVTGSFHTMTFHGRLVATSSSLESAASVVVRRSGLTAGTYPVSQTAVQKESLDPYSGAGTTREDAMSTANWVMAGPDRLRERANRGLRDAMGLTQDPPPPCNDPTESYLAVDGVARLVHGDLPAMLIGGIASLFFEMLHPHTMAGVAQHSRYQDDALGRVLQTANFIGATTYGSRPTAHAAIERVLAVHQGVRGIADDGIAYYANDPHLLAWVHDAGTSMFLRSYQRFGATKLSDADSNQYVAEVSNVARDLGCERPPRSVDELSRAIEDFRPELRLSADGAIARDFVARGVSESSRQRVAYRLLVASAYDLLQPWARELLAVPTRSAFHQVIERPVTRALTSALRFVVPPPSRVTSQS